MTVDDPRQPSRRITSTTLPVSMSDGGALPGAIACLINRDKLADINPSFENDTNIVPIPPRESAFSNCEKVVERDVEVYRKKAQSICMHLGVRSANVVSYNAQFSATIKEQQAICGMFDHRQSNPYVAALALVL
jgi:hypothetical protein